MIWSDSDPPIAADDFPEFAEPPQQKPPHVSEPKKESKSEDSTARQQDVDAVFARLRQERRERKR